MPNVAMLGRTLWQCYPHCAPRPSPTDHRAKLMDDSKSKSPLEAVPPHDLQYDSVSILPI